MLNEALIERYRGMTPAEKNEALDQILDMDVPPLEMVVAFYIILRPHRAEAMAVKLKSHLTPSHP